MTDTASTAPALSRFLTPRSIALVGFSSKAGSTSQACLHNLQVNGFAGTIHLVGRSGGQHGGMEVLASVDALPEDVDLALFLLPAGAVLDAVTAAVRRHVKAGVIFASGFAELGEEAARTQQQIADTARAGGMSLLGPNCLGYSNYVQPLNVGFLAQPALRPLPAGSTGSVAVVMQSGGLMGHVFRALLAKEVPVGYRVSTGNEVDVEIAHVVEHLANDPAIGIFALYAEQVRDPELFLRAVRKARQAGKHIVLMHSGRSEKAKAAAASHTGALAGDYGLMATVVRNAGVLLVETLETLVDAVELLARFPTPPVEGAALLVSSGAYCAHAHDICEDIGLALPKFSESTMTALKARMPGYVNLDNPFDLTTQGSVDQTLTADCLRQALADPQIGSVCIVGPYIGIPAALRELDAMLEVLQGQPKPVLLSLLGDESPMDTAYVQRVRESGMLLSRSSERQLRTLAAVTAYGRQLRDMAAQDTPCVEAGTERLRSGPVAEWEGKKLLAALQVPVPAGDLARDVAAARTVAHRIGYPVVMKLQSAKLLHKTEVGGVLLNIADDAALEKGWQTLMERGHKAGLSEVIDGVLVESMSKGGLEVIIGATRQGGWGPVVMVGLGGVWVEALKDVRVFPADFDEQRILGEIRQLKAATLLGAFRGAAPRDLPAIARVAAAVGRLMRAHPEIEEIEINPLNVYAEGEGAVALDALVKVA